MSFKLYIHYKSLRVKSYPKKEQESQFYDNKHGNDRGDINNVNTSQHVGGEFFSLVTNERNWWPMLLPVLADVLWGLDTWTLILVIKPGSLHSAPAGEAEWLFELLACLLDTVPTISGGTAMFGPYPQASRRRTAIRKKWTQGGSVCIRMWIHLWAWMSLKAIAVMAWRLLHRSLYVHILVRQDRYGK